MAETFIPAEVFHASEVVATEAIARGWSIWDLVDRIGTLRAPLDVLAWQIYAVRDPDCHMGEDAPMDLERVFGVSADFWRRTEALCREHRDRIAPLSREAHVWFFDEEPDA